MAGEARSEQLESGILSADATGRALMATGFFTEAKLLDAVAADALSAANFEAIAATGAISATVAGRAALAANYFDSATLTDKIAADAITAAVWEAKAAAGAISATADGRASLAAGFFNTATVVDKFASGELPAVYQGAPMVNRLNLATVPANGETVTIGSDVYEFRNTSAPPTGGTAGRIWVYEGGGVVATARANLVNAINNVTDATNIAYDGAVTEAFVASAVGNVVTIRSSSAVGSATVAASGAAEACADTLGAAADIWDAANTYGGKGASTARQCAVAAAITITAAMITLGSLSVHFTFTPTVCQVTCRARNHSDTYTITANAVVVTLAGGASPNLQAGDIIDVFVWQ